MFSDFLLLVYEPADADLVVWFYDFVGRLPVDLQPVDVLLLFFPTAELDLLPAHYEVLVHRLVLLLLVWKLKNLFGVVGNWLFYDGCVGD